MKIQNVIAYLLGLTFGITGISASAIDISFGNYDHDHDGRWDRNEYYNALKAWHHDHDHHFETRKEAYGQYRRFDMDHDGYLNHKEVRSIDHW